MRYRTRSQRPGAVIPILAICLIALLSFVALAIDLGLMMIARAQCQHAADIAALAGTRTLDGKSSDNNLSLAKTVAANAAKANTILNQSITDQQVASLTPGVYRYNVSNQRFQADFSSGPTADEAWGLMQVIIVSRQPTFFGKVMGVSTINVSAAATAVHRPRDVAIVLDFSGSMTYGSQPYYDPGNGVRSLNPDPRFPRFGPWSIFGGANMVLDPNNRGAAPSNFNTYVPPTPMQRVWPFVSTEGETFGPSNLTMNMPQGDALVDGFVLKDNSTNAFTRTGPFPNLSNVNVAYNFPTTILTPAPGEFANQQSANFVGDRFPLRFGVVTTTTAPTPDQYAQTVADYIGVTQSTITNGSRDSFFETYGYDWNFSTGALKDASLRFQGFTMGPGYTGKTFYMWPPDPRTPTGNLGDTGYVAGDWRVRFFLPRANSGRFMRDNSVFWNSQGRWKQQLPGNNANYLVNYDAVLAWLKRGPQTLPTSLRGGRVVYYDSIPDTVPINQSTGIILDTATSDQRFWKDYIDYVIGAGRFTDSYVLYGSNSSNSNTAGSTTLSYNSPSNTVLPPKITPRSFLTGVPQPYMRYDDNPIHPRMQFWFGPTSMLCYLQNSSNWIPGNVREAPCWQLKAGINSAVMDIKNNHPNDMASVIYFSSTDEYKTPRVSMSRNYSRMQRSLFYPFSLLDSLDDSNATIRPYTNFAPNTANPSGFSSIREGQIPNGGTSTCPELGFKVAFNQLSNATDQNGTVYTGRKGATKIVIFETDGVPNATAGGTLTSSGAGTSGLWYYDSIGNTNWLGNQYPLKVPPKDNPRAVVRQIVALDTANPPGYSTVRLPAQVHAVAFGEIFEDLTTGTLRESALRFLTAVQIDGNTTPKPAGDWDNDSLDINLYAQRESYKIITGDANTRVEKLRQALERIMQGGVQISLIQ